VEIPVRHASFCQSIPMSRPTMPASPIKPSVDSAQPKIRVAVFGSFYRGFYVLSDLLIGALSEKVCVVGVATDDPGSSFISAGKRVWQYPHTEHEQTMVASLAQSAGIEVYRDRVKTQQFYDILDQHWKPDLCIMATFGQKINARLFEAPSLGFFNLHPCIDDGWPSRYVGGNPFQHLLDEKMPYAQVAMHRVDDGFDTGELIAYSEKLSIPPCASVVDLHKITSPTAARLASLEIGKIIDLALANGYLSEHSSNALAAS
jgi:methionyl-tRNA formyltransferase